MSTTELTEQERLEQRKQDLQATIDSLQTDPTPFINDRTAELQDILDTLSQRKGGDEPYADRDPVSGPYPESKTVWQFRRDELMQLHNRPSEWVSGKEQELQDKLAYVEAQLNG